jgi:Protein of unknown function (DUF3551)
MRTVLALLSLVLCGWTLDPAKADQYRWCAIYGGGDEGSGGSYNCYFVTLQQCQWAISGMGGFCMPSPFVNGRPGPAPAQDQRKKKST